MRVPKELAEAFDLHFENKLSEFLSKSGWIPPEETLNSPRFLQRSIAPHVQSLSQLFNRLDDRELGPTDGTYWKSGGNAKNRRLAYILGFMPPNQFRVAAVWSELHRLGYRWPETLEFRALDLGSGPGTCPTGVLAGERFSPLGIPSGGNWALVDRDASILNFGVSWAETYAAHLGMPGVQFRKYVRKLDPTQELLPPNAPRFHLWTQSYFLNEVGHVGPKVLAETLLRTWKKHLETDGLVLWIEPALKAQSRLLLEIRKLLIEHKDEFGLEDLKVLLPCLGHQACGALAEPTDWCHEEAVWWRPPYLRKLDAMVELDRKSLPFSYLVLARSKRSVAELLPALSGHAPSTLERLVSPTIAQGRDQEFFICGEKGKRRARLQTEKEIGRGSLLLGAQCRGATESTRIEKIEGVL